MGSGSAYRTPIVPRFELGHDNAVFAVWPLAACAGIVTAYVGASTSATVGDTCLFAVDKTGHLLTQRLIGCYATTIHTRAMRAAGWEVEVVVPRG